MAELERGMRAARPVWAEVDLDSVAHNVAVVRSWLRPGVQLGASIKGDAYGHGANEIALAFERAGVEFLTTADLQQAIHVRRAGCTLPIILLGASLPDGLSLCLREGITPTVYSEAGALAVAASSTVPTPVFVKVDAGLGRLGVPLEEAPSFVEAISRLPRLVVSGIYTHLPFSESDGERWARERLAMFAEVVEGLRRSGISIPTVQAISSPGVLAGLDDPTLTAVCAGSVLYGLPVGYEWEEQMRSLRRVLSAVRTKLIHVVTHSHARAAGSGGVRTYAAGMTTGVVPIGIADGYAKPAAGETLEMLVGHTRVPVVAVTMAQTTLDLSDVPDASVGDDVVVFGCHGDSELGLDEVARWTGSSVLDVMLRFNRRLAVDYLHLGASSLPVLEPARTFY